MKFLRSFVYAFRGMMFGIQERNMKVHLFATVLVVILGIAFSVTMLEWTVLFLCIGAVLSAELVNTAIEEICDVLNLISPELYHRFGKPKDISAGAVLVLAIISTLIGALIFLPRFFLLLYR